MCCWKTSRTDGMEDAANEEFFTDIDERRTLLKTIARRRNNKVDNLLLHSTGSQHCLRLRDVGEDNDKSQKSQKEEEEV